MERSDEAPGGEWLSVAQVAALLGLSPSRVQQLLRTGQIPGRKVGRDWILRRGLVEQFKALPPGSPGRPRSLK